MSIEATIHDWYAASASLVALLPASRFVTGHVQDETQQDLPYCTLNRESDAPSYRTNCGRMDAASLRFQLWHEAWNSGNTIADAIVAAFDNGERTAGAITIHSMRLSNRFHLQEDDGVWQFLLDFDVTYTQDQ
jgi:hypothetical protein